MRKCSLIPGVRRRNGPAGPKKNPSAASPLPRGHREGPCCQNCISSSGANSGCPGIPGLALPRIWQHSAPRPSFCRRSPEALSRLPFPESPSLLSSYPVSQPCTSFCQAHLPCHDSQWSADATGSCGENSQAPKVATRMNPDAHGLISLCFRHLEANRSLRRFPGLLICNRRALTPDPSLSGALSLAFVEHWSCHRFLNSPLGAVGQATRCRAGP